jgi:uncharacterized 2Fe-2S/4Fe-4S cluster protein (DUF4445 family)
MEENRKKKCTVRFEPAGLQAEVLIGTVLLDAAHKAGIYLSSLCGGDGYCGKCKVTIDEGQFQSRPTSLLTPDENRRNVVLACQTRVLSDLKVTVPKSHSLETGQILMDMDAHRFSELAGDVQAGIFRFDPLVRKIFVEMSPPTIHDHTADHERLYLAIREKTDAPIMQTGFRILQKLSRLLQSCNYKATVTIGRRGKTTEVIEIEPGNHCKRNFAIAVDLGTTTVVAHLVDLTDAVTIDRRHIIVKSISVRITFEESFTRKRITRSTRCKTVSYWT